MRVTLIISLLLLMTFAAGCVDHGIPADNPNNVNNNVPADPADHVDAIEEQIRKMTLDEKIGQLVMVGLEGYEIDSVAQEMIEKYKIGGFILFGRNIRDYHQALELVNALKAANSSNKIPLFLAIDQEGGLVNRMPNEFEKLPTNRAIGKVNDDNFSYEIGKIIAEQLRSLGLNMNFAPVLDIDSNPKNPVIGNRSFGPDAEIVAKLGTQTMKGIQTQAISVVKHFPGHGDTSVDFDIGLPVVTHDLDRIQDFELKPFKAAIEAGADAVMVAHIVLTEVDPEYPATLSAPLISEILRKVLNFDGVVITDDMTMGAIVENHSIGDAAIKSVLAGADIVLVCHDNAKQVEVLKALKAAVMEGVISEDNLDEHLYRILKLKEKYHISHQRNEKVEVEEINERTFTLLNKYMDMQN